MHLVLISNGNRSHFAKYLCGITINNLFKQLLASEKLEKKIDFCNFSIQTMFWKKHTFFHWCGCESSTQLAGLAVPGKPTCTLQLEGGASKLWNTVQRFPNEV